MSTYSLTSGSRRWWWPSAAAGVAAAGLIGVIVVSPASGGGAPAEITRQPPPAAVFPQHSAGDDRPCFMVRPRWNVALDGFQPTCGEPSRPHGTD
ncbi:MAG: hypothetical protein ACXWXO_12155 [Nocardioides sp.]